MLIALMLLTRDKQWREFQILPQDLERGFDLLIRVAQGGDTLVEAKVIDQERTVSLPLDFLDQQPDSNPISQLRKQWELALAQPLTAHAARKLSHPEWIQRYQQIHQDRTNHQRLLLSYMQALYQTAQERMGDSPHKARLLDFYKQTMDRCSNSIVRLETNHPFANRCL